MKMHYSRRTGSTRLLALCLGTGALLIAPSAALAADTGTVGGAGTVRALIGPDGKVTAVKQVSATGTVTGYSGQLPIKMTITHTASGGTQTYSYHVENTFSKTETVHYTDTAGNDQHTTVTLQLPLVAQLGVDVPGSLKNLSAAGATITTDGGTRHVLWDMVLFTPLGSSVQDVSFTATGSGSPAAQLRATPIDPDTAPGLSSKAQDKTAEYQQADFWGNYAHGGNDGLTKLAAGANQLYVGLASGLGGTNQAASGSTQLYDGAKKLHSGLVAAGSGFDQAASGSTQLYDGSKKLLFGMNMHKPGTAGPSDPGGLKYGVTQVRNGVNKAVVSGIKPLHAGSAQITQGLASLLAAFGTVNDFTNPGLTFGLNCAQDVLELVINGNPAAVPDHCYDGAPFDGMKPALPALSSVPGTALYSLILSGLNTKAMTPINQAVQTQVVPGLAQLSGGSQQVTGGLGQLANTKTGLPAAVTGLDSILAGIGDKQHGKTLIGGESQVVDGLQLLSSGLVTGAQQFPSAVSGSGQIADGLGQLSTGLVAGAKSFPAAVDGAKQVADGIGQVHAAATGPLEQQLKQASQNAHQQIAVLQAAAGLSAQTPGGAGTSYILSQPGGTGGNGGFVLTASKTTASSDNSHTGRNALLISLGGILALAIGMGVGIAVGRQRVAA